MNIAQTLIDTGWLLAERGFGAPVARERVREVTVLARRLGVGGVALAVFADETAPEVVRYRAFDRLATAIRAESGAPRFVADAA